MSQTSTASGKLRAEIAEEVRALLGRRRMSDIALARTIERSHTYVYRRLAGETAFDADDLEKIAEALGVNVVDLLPRSQRGLTPQELRPLVTAAYVPKATLPAPRRAGTLKPPADLVAKLPRVTIPREADGLPPYSPRRTAPTGAHA